jgi:hypothetical protein
MIDDDPIVRLVGSIVAILRAAAVETRDTVDTATSINENIPRVAALLAVGRGRN